MQASIVCFLVVLQAAAKNESVETFKVNGTGRTAIVYANSEKAGKEGSPIVFVFHGHGGTARRFVNRLKIHEQWPKAIVVYMQGLTGVVGINDPKGKKTGWQKNPKDHDDRDIQFFDTALEQLSKKHKINADRVYVMGHSNGSRFASVLWNQRGKKLAAVCTCAGQPGQLLKGAVPLSVFAIAGENDPIVPFEGQQKSIDGMRKLLATEEVKAKKAGLAKFEVNKDGLELATYIHPGAHEFPVKAVPLIIEFFQRHERKVKT